MTTTAGRATAASLTDAAVASLAAAPDARLREVVSALVRHLHAFAAEVRLQLLALLGRHPWRPAHLHMTVRAPGYRQLTTHVFDAASRYLDSDAVFGVKPSLVREFARHEPGSPDRPAGVGPDQFWYSVEFDVVLRRAAG
ncbi:MAG: hypothetical protein IRZ08_13515 [Frankia sp.]|nr:hypothetical protein [Frankia sp.]